MSYSALAKYYDRFMADFPYQKWGEFIVSHIDITKPTIELACGTGNLTIELYKRGIEIQGCDIDEKMLAVANNKTLEQNLNIDFFLSDMVHTNLGDYHNIICPCDGINSLLSVEELRCFFENVARNLTGIFIFDFSTKKKLKSIAEQIYYEDHEDVTYFWDSEYDDEYDEAKFYLTFFEKLKTGYYNREDVTIVQKGLTIPFIKKLLTESTLDIIGIYHDYTKIAAKEDSDRVVFVCSKKK